MSLKESLNEHLGWSSPIGLGIFLIGAGIAFWGIMAGLQILTNL
jgi:hypothetical protein